MARGAKMERKVTMETTIPASNACSSRTLHGMTIWTRSGFLEGGHQLEKLEFALALAEAKGDLSRCTQLRILRAACARCAQRRHACNPPRRVTHEDGCTRWYTAGSAPAQLPCHLLDKHTL